MSRRAVLALMAHPDDAEILCAGTLIRLAEAAGKFISPRWRQAIAVR